MGITMVITCAHSEHAFLYRSNTYSNRAGLAGLEIGRAMRDAKGNLIKYESYEKKCGPEPSLHPATSQRISLWVLSGYDIVCMC